MKKNKNKFNITPVNSSVLVEILSTNEVLGTEIVLATETKTNEQPQGVILGMGANAKTNEYQVGDRVLFTGNGVKLPYKSENDKELLLIDWLAIKAVIG